MTDSRHEALKAMAAVLEDCGHTRDTAPEDVQTRDAESCVGAFICELIRQGDTSYAMEFLVETRHVEKLLQSLGRSMIGHSDAQPDHIARTAARWYGEHLIPEALELLPTRAELTEATMIDAEIDARRESA